MQFLLFIIKKILYSILINIRKIFIKIKKSISLLIIKNNNLIRQRKII
jgi:hypothetical protein